MKVAKKHKKLLESYSVFSYKVEDNSDYYRFIQYARMGKPTDALIIDMAENAVSKSVAKRVARQVLIYNSCITNYGSLNQMAEKDQGAAYDMIKALEQLRKYVSEHSTFSTVENAFKNQVTLQKELVELRDEVIQLDKRVTQETETLTEADANLADQYERKFKEIVYRQSLAIYRALPAARESRDWCKSKLEQGVSGEEKRVLEEAHQLLTDATERVNESALKKSVDTIEGDYPPLRQEEYEARVEELLKARDDNARRIYDRNEALIRN